MSLVIRSLELVMTAGFYSQCPGDDLPEIAFVGRSNVGKSSLINTLLERKRLAHTSSRPGKTQTLNFFLINEVFHLVDLPGYGYAALSKVKQEEISRLIFQYLSQREQLELVVILVDSRHKPSQLDLEMVQLLQSLDLPFLIVGTKRDKVKRSQWNKAAADLRKALNLAEAPILFSAGEAASKDALWKKIAERVPEIIKK
ncbi:MAG: YihA family ribosome biogenesis GTP-binding protein [Firmicutes bacterium]|nr:YihA family ribosome biogenesis GTP-binding protein [Bacillota bacterium]